MNARTTLEHTLDTTIPSLATKGMGGGTAASFAGWLTSNEMLTILGLVITAAGFLVNLFFRWRQDRRETELHLARMKTVVED